MHHTIARPEDKVDTVDDTGIVGGGNGGSSSSSSQARKDSTGASASSNDTVVNKLFDILSLYRNRDKFTDQQKAMIYVAVLMIAALICAAVVEMFLR